MIYSINRRRRRLIEFQPPAAGVDNHSMTRNYSRTADVEYDARVGVQMELYLSEINGKVTQRIYYGVHDTNEKITCLSFINTKTMLNILKNCNINFNQLQ